MLDGDRDPQGSQGFVCRNVITEDVRFVMGVKKADKVPSFLCCSLPFIPDKLNGHLARMSQ